METKVLWVAVFISLAINVFTLGLAILIATDVFEKTEQKAWKRKHE